MKRIRQIAIYITLIIAGIFAPYKTGLWIINGYYPNVIVTWVMGAVTMLIMGVFGYLILKNK
jgi:hypothetical protein